MTNDRPHTVDEKQKRDAALNLADFKADDIASIAGDQLLAEVAEDFGHREFLAEAFDAVALPVIANQGGGALDAGAAAILSTVHTVRSPASLHGLPRRSPAAPSFPRAALATLAEWLAVPLRRRVVLGALATLLLVAVLTPGIYPRLVDRSAERSVPAAKDEPAAPEMRPGGPATADQAAAVQPAPRAAAAPAPIPQPMAAAPGEPSAEASARGRLSGQRQAAAKSVPADGSGFVVQLSASKSEAEAQSTLRALKSKYAALEGREPTVRRKDQGKRGVFYAVQVGPFETKQAAEQLCARVKAAGGSCFATKNGPAEP